MKTSVFRRLWVALAAYPITFYASVLNRMRVRGTENIPREGGVLVASNHISAYDTVFLPTAILRAYPLQMIWAPAKEELFRNPLLGWIFRSWGAFPVRRKRDAGAVEVIVRLARSSKVMIFPEGTRSRDGKLGKGSRGVGKIIYDAGTVVVPAALAGLNRWRFPGTGQRASLDFGKPVDFSDLRALPDTKETHLLVVERLMAAIGGLLDGSSDAADKQGHR